MENLRNDLLKSNASLGNNITALRSFLKPQHAGHTGGYFIGIMGDIDDICFAVTTDNINRI